MKERVSPAKPNPAPDRPEPQIAGPLTTSIVIGTFNGARFIEQQLQSLLTQTVAPCEIIISDDRSEDHTVAIAERVAAQTDIPFRISVNPTNLGFGENFLRAAARASGDLIAFCDQDDIWRPDKVALCTTAFAETNTVLAVHAGRLVDQDGRLLGGFRQGIRRSRSSPPLSYGPWGVFFGFSIVFRRMLLEAIPSSARGLDYVTGKSQLSHDRWIMFLANMFGATRELEEELVDYRQHGRNLFGASGGGAAELALDQAALIARRYVASAQNQRALIDAIPAAAADRFPLFNRQAATAFWDRALDQQLARLGIYTAPTRGRGLVRIMSALRNGAYRTVQGGSFNLRPLAKDLLQIMRRSRP